MELAFTKLQGCGNDYLFVDATERPLERASEIAARLSDRRFGVGSDGLILVCPSDSADFRMEMYNADGSRGAMCGNGIRGVAKFVYDRGLTERTKLHVETDSGIKELDLEIAAGRVARVRVEMGLADFDPAAVPVLADAPVVDEAIDVAGRSWRVTCVSMGNPHCVTFDVDPEEIDLPVVGPQFETDARFPDRVNTEFVAVESPTRLRMRVWERGSGETLACGTGACAVLAAAVRTGRAERRATVVLRGGELEIEVREDDSVVMTGPSVEVFSGTAEIG